MTWCEHCRDHYPTDHYGDDGCHKVGNEYGVWGEEHAELDRLRTVVVYAADVLHGRGVRDACPVCEEAIRILAPTDD